jgi:tellurite resistance protein TerC
VDTIDAGQETLGKGDGFGIELRSMFYLLGFTWPDSAELFNALPVIFSLIVIEGLLSVDNALAIAAMASHLPRRQRILALRLGILGAYVFRGLALLAAAWILETPLVMWIGAAYLLYLMSHHFTGAGDEDADGKADGSKVRGLFGTIMAIEIMDLSLSVDNVVAAAALDRRLWVVMTGVFIGILALRFVAGACIKLIVKFPILEHAAFLLIGFVGFILVGELVVDTYRADGSHCHLHSGWKFLGIALILALSIWYSRSEAVQRVLRPLIRFARIPMMILATVVGAALQLVIWPCKWLFRLVRKPTA